MFQKEALRKMIREKVIIRLSEQLIIKGDQTSEGLYIFDFRKVLLSPEELAIITDGFLEKLQLYEDIQIGGMESAAIPLITSLVLAKKVPGFYIRKSRKKTGLMNQFEGPIHRAKPVILVDDIISSGGSILKQIVALEKEGIQVVAVVCILIFHPEAWYEELEKRNIKIYFLISHDEVSHDLMIPPINHTKSTLISVPTFSPVARFFTQRARYNIESPRPTPFFDGEKIYVGMDDGIVYALNPETLEVVWKYQPPHSPGGNTIVGSCCGNGKYIFVGSTDGNCIALDSQTGGLIWKNECAQRIESSPCYIESNNTLCIGIENVGGIQKGGIILFDAETGKIVWSISSPKNTQGSPVYSDKYHSIFFGSNDGLFYRVDASNGKIIWIASFEAEIKSKPLISDDQECIFFGAFDGTMYGLQIKTGKILFQVKTQAPIYSMPYLDGENIYFSSLDKKIYAANFKSGRILWSFVTGGKIFAAPVVRDGHVFCGSSDGSLYILNAKTGNLEKKWVGVESIVSAPTFLDTKHFVIRTIANEIYLFTI